MTAHALIEEQKKAEAVGMNDYITSRSMRRPCSRRSAFLPEGEIDAARREARSRIGGRVDPTIAGIDAETALKRIAGNTRLYKDLLRRSSRGRKRDGESSRSVGRRGLDSSPNASPFAEGWPEP